MRVVSEDEKTYITIVELHGRPTELNFEFYNVGGSYFATLKTRASSREPLFANPERVPPKYPKMGIMP